MSYEFEPCPKASALLVLPGDRVHLVDVSPWPAKAEIQNLIGSYIDVRYCAGQRWHLYYAAFAKGQNFPLNRIVSRLMQEVTRQRVRLHGSVLIVGIASKGMDIDVPKPKSLAKLLIPECKETGL